MYQIDRTNNCINPLDKRTFSELGFREREHLQEWIAKNPGAFEEDLLIIQKEYSGFSETNERLDLLALDKQGNLVIIENKLDDSGRDVTWQALKYASYCSSLSKENIRAIFQDYLDRYEAGTKAEDKLAEFFEDQEYEELLLNKGFHQRLILVAAKFRKEVTSTVLWLLNFKIQVQCFKVIPYSMGENLFLNFEQIIPTKDAEEFMISMADKAQDDIDAQTKNKNRHYYRKEFWTKLLEEMNKKSDLFKNISTSIYNWIAAGSGVSGISLNFAVSKTYGRAEIYIDVGDKEKNNKIFDLLNKHFQAHNKEYYDKLVWERLEDKRACRIKDEIDGNLYDKETWGTMIEYMTDSMVALDKAFRGEIKKAYLESK